MRGQILESPRFVDTLVVNTHPDGPTALYEGRSKFKGYALRNEEWCVGCCRCGITEGAKRAQRMWGARQVIDMIA
jgi:hypothetical protein